LTFTYGRALLIRDTFFLGAAHDAGDRVEDRERNVRGGKQPASGAALVGAT
jgi:hypothetical protein